jgi:hypothetical protein
MALSVQRITDIAPVLMMHPDETCWPMDPLEFIKQSRFRHHRGLRADRGYNKRINKWVEGDKEMSDYYDIPVEVINRFGPGTDNSNRRPRDSNAGKRLNVFLEAKGHPPGVKNPKGIVPVFYYQADTKQFTRVSYWWFMGYNQAPLTLDHQGDWEHVTLKVENDVVTAVHFARHNDPVKFIPIGGFEMAGEKVRVYCAKGTHASYPHEGDWPLPVGFKDETRDLGYPWDTALKLLPLETQPWRDYAGAWGQVGELPETTGPLGPWHKRNKA